MRTKIEYVINNRSKLVEKLILFEDKNNSQFNNESYYTWTKLAEECVNSGDISMFAQGYKAEELTEDVDWDKMDQIQTECYNVMQKFGGDLDDFRMRESNNPGMVPAIEIQFESYIKERKSKKEIEKIRKALSDKFNELGYDLDPYDDYYMEVDQETVEIPFGKQPKLLIWFKAFDNNWDADQEDIFTESKSNSKLTEKLSLNDAWNALTEDM